MYFKFGRLTQTDDCITVDLLVGEWPFKLSDLLSLYLIFSATEGTSVDINVRESLLQACCLVPVHSGVSVVARLLPSNDQHRVTVINGTGLTRSTEIINLIPKTSSSPLSFTLFFLILTYFNLFFLILLIFVYF